MKIKKFFFLFISLLIFLTIFIPGNAIFTEDFDNQESPENLPVISSIEPEPALIGEAVTIKGSGFGQEQGDNFVTFFNEVKSDVITAWSDTEINCLVPEGAETGPVKIATPSGISNGYEVIIEAADSGETADPEDGEDAENADGEDDAATISVDEFAINDGEESTENMTVVLSSICSGNPAYYMASESECFCNGAWWQPYSSSVEFELSGGAGTKTIYFKVKDENGNESAVVNSSINLLVEAALESETEYDYTIMHIDYETLKEWMQQIKNNPRAEILPEAAKPPTGASVSLLSHLSYVPSQRDQGACGNCWVWAGTGVMEVALSVERGIKDRLSIQYFNSNYSGSLGWACCGGWLSEVDSFYSGTMKAVPWSNTNASYQDTTRGCSGSTTVDPATISTNPNYLISDITAQTITTHSISQSTAISNIKNILNQNRAISFSFYLPDDASWNVFYDFWGNGSETDVFNYDFVDGLPWVSGQGGGHSVLCIGYNDTDPDNSYWIMVNSWGITANRPNGIFRVDMDMNYDNSISGIDYSLWWETLDIEYTAPDQEDVEAFVSRFYELCLGRDSDPSGLDYWTGELMSGDKTGEDIGYGFVMSPEYTGKNTTNTQFVTMLYNVFLDRTPDSGGLDFWVGQLNTSATRPGVLNGFIHSAEFAAVCSSYGIIPYTPGLAGFVTRFYTLTLERMPDTEGRDYWVSQLESGAQAGKDIANGFIFSSEFLAHNHPNSRFISILYNAFFDRVPDADGYAYWMGQLSAGKTRQYVLDRFIESYEFVGGVCNSYAIIPFFLDYYEADNMPSQAKTLTVNGEGTRHTFHPTSAYYNSFFYQYYDLDYINFDADFIKFYVSSAGMYSIETYGLMVDGFWPDTYLMLYDSEYDYLTYDDDGGYELASKISYSLARGWYYVLAMPYDSYSEGYDSLYNIRVYSGTGAAQPELPGKDGEKSQKSQDGIASDLLRNLIKD